MLHGGWVDGGWRVDGWRVEGEFVIPHSIWERMTAYTMTKKQKMNKKREYFFSSVPIGYESERERESMNE